MELTSQIYSPQLTGPQRHKWQESALCVEIGDAPFFPELGAKYTEGRKICARCPVRDECLDYAMETEECKDDRVGLFGGKSPRERTALAEAKKALLKKEKANVGTTNS